MQNIDNTYLWKRDISYNTIENRIWVKHPRFNNTKCDKKSGIYVISNDNKVLLVRSYNNKKFGFPKGSVNYKSWSKTINLVREKYVHNNAFNLFNIDDLILNDSYIDSYYETAINELCEETGLTVTESRPLLQINNFDESLQSTYYMYLYNKNAEDYNPNIYDIDAEISAIKWVDVAWLKKSCKFHKINLFSTDMCDILLNNE